MPVAVACPCGAKLRVPDAAAGKRVKCPKCGNPVAVPAAEAEYEEVDDEPTPPPVAKKKPRPVDDDEPTPAKRPTAAKRKAEPVEVNEAVDDDDDDTPKKKRRRDDDDEDDDTPKKKGKKGKGKKGKKEEAKSNLPLILGIGGGVFVLLAVIGIVVGVMMSGGGGSAKGTNQTPTQPAPPPKPALPSGWSTFKGDGFSVAVPDAIQFKEQQQGAGPGQPPAGSKAYTNGVQPQPVPNGPPFFIYVVSVGDVPPAVAAEFAKSPEAGWEAMKKAGGGGAKLENEKVMQVSGSDGRQYTLNAGFIAGVARVVVKGNKGYSIAVMSQAAPAEDAPEVKPFFDTFVLE
jgi:hypothetical protein